MRRALLAVLVALAAVTLGLSDLTRLATAQEAGVANVAPVPPPGGLTQVVAGTTAIQALIDAQTFDVESIWRFDISTQTWTRYVVGALAFVNTLTSLDPADVVTIKAAPAAAQHRLLAQAVVAAINEARHQQGLPALQVQLELQTAAELYSDFVVKSAICSRHVASNGLSTSACDFERQPDGPKYPVHYLDGTPQTRAERQEYQGQVREVWRYGFSLEGELDPSADRYVQGWLNSADHRPVILDPAARDVGVGCSQQPDPEGLFAPIVLIGCIVDFGAP